MGPSMTAGRKDGWAAYEGNSVSATDDAASASKGRIEENHLVTMRHARCPLF